MFPNAAEDFQLVEAEGAVTGEEGFENREGGFGQGESEVEDRLVGIQQIRLGHGFDELSALPDPGLNETHQIAEAVEGVAMLVARLVADDGIP